MKNFCLTEIHGGDGLLVKMAEDIKLNAEVLKDTKVSAICNWYSSKCYKIFKPVLQNL